MTDNEWWTANVNRANASRALRTAGLLLSGWTNRKPTFALGANVDWAVVEQLCLGAPSSPSDRGPEAPPPIQVKRGRGRPRKHQ